MAGPWRSTFPEDQIPGMFGHTLTPSRVQAMRRSLHAVLSAQRPGRDFGYFLSQRGMFSYTGLSAAQVDRLREQFGVYLVRSGRMCVAGLNTRNVEATASAIAAVI